MENRNIIQIFCRWNLQKKKKKKKKNDPHQSFNGSYKKSVKALVELQDTENIKR